MEIYKIKKMTKMNPVVHFEMPAKDKKRVKKFYENVFGWELQITGPEFGGYILATTSPVDKKQMHKKKGAINGGFFEYDNKVPGRTVPSVVISVGNLENSIKSVNKAGGKVVGKPQDIPGIGLWVVFIDSEGNRVSMLQPSR